jgi:hypothetical protein
MTWPRRHLQHSTLELVASFKFNPSRQLHASSSPTSTLVVIQIPNPVAMLFPPLLLHGRVVLDAAAAR